MADDWTADPDAKAYLDRAERELVPMIEQSSIAVQLVPRGETDPKFAIELGYCIMLNKPIIALVHEDTTPPPKLLAVADEVVTYREISEAQAAMQDAIQRVLAKAEAP